MITVGLSPRLNDAIAADPGMDGHTVLAVPSAEGALDLLGARKVDALVASVDACGPALVLLVEGIRGSPSEGALVLAIADSRDSEQQAKAAAVNQVVGSSWFSQTTAHDIGLCIEVAHAARG